MEALAVALLTLGNPEVVATFHGPMPTGVTVSHTGRIFVNFPRWGDKVDYTVAEVGVDRLVWGGHGPSRSYSTELAKVFDADLTQAQRAKIFGGNLRRLAEPIFRKKGYKL